MNNELTLQLFAFDCGSVPADHSEESVKAIMKFAKALQSTGRKQEVVGIRFSGSKDIPTVKKPLEKIKMKEFGFTNDGTGACPMLDRTSKLMYDVGVVLNDTPEPERPSQVIMTIIVFGRDNASTQCTYEQLRDMIALQRDVYKWRFFLMTDFTINMEKLGIAEEDTILIKKSEKDWFKRPFEELAGKITDIFPKE